MYAAVTYCHPVPWSTTIREMNGTRVALVDPPAAQPRTLLMLLHGAMGHAREMLPIGLLLDADDECIIAALQAPHSVETGAVWFDPAANDADDMLRHSVDVISATLNDLGEEFVVGAERAVVVGYSQGGTATLALAMQDLSVNPAAVACLSGALPPLDSLTASDSGRRRPLVRIHHGRSDETIPVAAARSAAKVIGNFGLPVEYKEYDAGHRLTLESLLDLRSWIRGLPTE